MWTTIRAEAGATPRRFRPVHATSRRDTPGRASRRFAWRRLPHFAQVPIPLAGAGVFRGLSAATLSLLRAERLPPDWASDVRLAIPGMATMWSGWLAWWLAGRYSQRLWQRGLATMGFAGALAVVDSVWWLMFWGRAH